MGGIFLMSANGNLYIHRIDQTPATPTTGLFNLNSPQFLSLATEKQILELKKNIIKINIEDALAHLKPQGYLEVTLPILGMADFLATHLKDSVWNEIPQSFPSVLSLNGSGNGLFSRPDFIRVRDIIGNEYEILVNHQGQVDIPEEGSGRFSMLSEITLIYSVAQVIQKEGFEPLSAQAGEANQIYLLPPPCATAPFVITVRTAHLDERNQRQIDFEEDYFFAVNPDREASGLTEMAARSMIRHLFSEFDFIKCIWGGKGELDFAILHPNYFNDFRLSYEALGHYYNGLLKAIIHQRLPVEFILSKVPKSRFSSLSSLEGPFDDEDKRLIKTFGVEVLQNLAHASPRRAVSQGVPLDLSSLLIKDNGEKANSEKLRK